MGQVLELLFWIVLGLHVYPRLGAAANPVAGAIVGAIAVRYIIGWLNRRSDPRHAKPPPDVL